MFHRCGRILENTHLKVERSRFYKYHSMILRLSYWVLGGTVQWQRGMIKHSFFPHDGYNSPPPPQKKARKGDGTVYEIKAQVITYPNLYLDLIKVFISFQIFFMFWVLKLYKPIKSLIYEQGQTPQDHSLLQSISDDSYYRWSL